MTTYRSSSDILDRLLEGTPDGYVAVELVIGPSRMQVLVDDVSVAVTLTGDDVTIDKAYARDFPDRLIWHDTVTGRQGWEINLDVLAHMSELKRERGISRYRGVPLTLGSDDVLEIRWEEIAKLVALRVA